MGLFAGTWVVALSVWHFAKIESRWEAGITEDGSALAPAAVAGAETAD